MGTMHQGVEQVAPDEAEQLRDGGAVLLDVRQPHEWQAGHAADSIHVILDQLPEAHAGTLPRDQRIVVVCRTGARSHRAAQFLKQQGYDAVNLAGGLKQWVESGRQVVDDSGTTGQVV